MGSGNPLPIDAFCANFCSRFQQFSIRFDYINDSATVTY